MRGHEGEGPLWDRHHQTVALRYELVKAHEGIVVVRATTPQTKRSYLPLQEDTLLGALAGVASVAGEDRSEAVLRFVERYGLLLASSALQGTFEPVSFIEGEANLLHTALALIRALQESYGDDMHPSIARQIEELLGFDTYNKLRFWKPHEWPWVVEARQREEAMWRERMTAPEIGNGDQTYGVTDYLDYTVRDADEAYQQEGTSFEPPLPANHDTQSDPTLPSMPEPGAIFSAFRMPPVRAGFPERLRFLLWDARLTTGWVNPSDQSSPAAVARLILCAILNGRHAGPNGEDSGFDGVIVRRYALVDQQGKLNSYASTTSLLNAAYTRLLDAATLPSLRVAQCKYCGTLFASRDPRQTVCSTTCGNTHRTQRRRRLLNSGGNDNDSATTD